MARHRQFLVRDPDSGEFIWSDSPAPPAKSTKADQPWVSDSLGFVATQLPAFEADRVRNGFTAVEFTPDPKVPGFMQVRIHGKKAREEYISHRSKTDDYSRAGHVLGPGSLEDAARHESIRPSTRPTVVLRD